MPDFVEGVGDAVAVTGVVLAEGVSTVVGALGAVGGAIGDAVAWAGDVVTGGQDTGSQGAQAVPELVARVLGSRGAPEWHQNGQAAADLAGECAGVGDRLWQVVTGLESVWSGAGADAVRERIEPVAQVAGTAAQAFTGNAQNVTGLAHGYDGLKTALIPLPEAPPARNAGDVVTPWDTDAEDRINQYNATAARNLERYQGFTAQSQTGGQGLGIDYGQLAPFDGESFTVTDTPAHPPVTPFTGSSGGHDRPAPATPVGGPGGVLSSPSSPQHVQPPVALSAAAPVPDESSAGHTRAAAAAAFPPGGPNVPGLGAVTSPPAGGSGSPPVSGLLHGPVPVAPGGLFPGHRASRTGGVDRIGPSARGAGFPAPGGSPVPGPGKVTGGAPGTGSGGMRGAPAGPTAGLVAGRGMSGGGYGAAGPPAMAGPGAGRGGSSEDQDHQRKYHLDTDEAFTLTPDGTRPTDPRTGLPVTPPTIGA